MEDKQTTLQLPPQTCGHPASQPHATTTEGAPSLHASTVVPDHARLDTAEDGGNNSLQLVTCTAEMDDALINNRELTDAVPFPSLSNDAPTSSKPENSHVPSDGEDEEQATAKSFPRSTSPASAAQRNRGARYQKVGEEGLCQMHRFSLYETTSRYYLVGGDVVDRKFRILKIDRTADSGDLSIAEDDVVYTKKEMNQLLNTVDDGNKASGGLKLKCSAWGLLGFIRFTGAYYMLVITKRSQVAMIGGHYIYQIDGTELISLTMSSSSRFKVDKDAEEARFIGILNNLDLSRSFYFSYSYDITRTLQQNILRQRQTMQHGNADSSLRHWNSMFVWNHHLLHPATEALKNIHDWCLPIVHGFVDQASKSFSSLRDCTTDKPQLYRYMGELSISPSSHDDQDSLQVHGF